jgi:hypothetical protein
MLATVAVARWLDWPARSFRLRCVADDLSGRSLTRAIRDIDEIARFAVE